MFNKCDFHQYIRHVYYNKGLFSSVLFWVDFLQYVAEVMPSSLLSGLLNLVDGSLVFQASANQNVIQRYFAFAVRLIWTLHSKTQTRNLSPSWTVWWLYNPTLFTFAYLHFNLLINVWMDEHGIWKFYPKDETNLKSTILSLDWFLLFLPPHHTRFQCVWCVSLK